MNPTAENTPPLPEGEDFTAIFEGAVQSGEQEPIIRFRDDHYFLSNMYPLAQGVTTPDGFVVPSVEVAYKADKHRYLARIAVLSSVDGYAANRKSKHLLEAGEEIVDGWHANKADVMRWYVYQKFGRNEDVASLLADTGSRLLVEGNFHKDYIWGVAKIKGGTWWGQNKLGLLLMETRGLVNNGTDLIEAAEEVLEGSQFLQQIRQDSM